MKHTAHNNMPARPSLQAALRMVQAQAYSKPGQAKAAIQQVYTNTTATFKVHNFA